MDFSTVDILVGLAEILIFFLFYYQVLKVLQGTRGAGILKGVAFFLIIILIVLLVVSQRFELLKVRYFLEEWLLKVFLFSLIVLFQPELRRAFVKLGESSQLFSFFGGEKSVVVDVIGKAAIKLANNRVGALIAVEREIGLNTFAEGGVRLDSEISVELLESIFYPGSALHDGGVIVKEGRIIAAGCLFPLSDNPNIAKNLGTRHRAGIGITEESDAVTVIVSEETGRISIGTRGYLMQNLSKEDLIENLRKLYLKGYLAEKTANGNGVALKEKTDGVV